MRYLVAMTVSPSVMAMLMEDGAPSLARMTCAMAVSTASWIVAGSICAWQFGNSLRMRWKRSSESVVPLMCSNRSSRRSERSPRLIFLKSVTSPLCMNMYRPK